MIPGIFRRFAILSAIVSWVYILIIRPWHLKWGATDAEVQGSLPGDDLIPHPMMEATRAITIDSPPKEIWPWLVQIGYERAGFYSYDRLDHAGIPSADRIVPELQNLKVGDVIPLDPKVGLKVEQLEPTRALAAVGRDIETTAGGATMSLSMVLDKSTDRQTRLIFRVRGDFEKSGLLSALYNHVFFEPIDFIMMRKQLIGIKQRVENADDAVQPPASEQVST